MFEGNEPLLRENGGGDGEGVGQSSSWVLDAPKFHAGSVEE